MEKGIDEFFKEFPASPCYTAKPWYNVAGDCVEFHFADDECFAERLDDVLTVYLSFANKQPVGCQVKGISALLRKVGDWGIKLRKEKVQLAMLFLASKSFGDESQCDVPERRKLYDILARRAGAEEVEVALV